MEEKDEIVISFKDIGNVLKKNLVFIIVTSMVFALCSFFITNFFIEKQYTSTVSLYVELKEQTTDASANSGSLNMYNYAQKLVATYIRMLNTNTYRATLSEELNEKYSPTELSRMIKFKNDEETEVFDVQVVTNSPNTSKEIADAITKTAPKTINNINSKANLKICDYAQVPSKPSSPSLSKNVLIALAAGLVLSIFISFLRYLMDKKIKYDEEMTEVCGLPILGAIPTFSQSGGTIKKAHTNPD